MRLVVMMMLAMACNGASAEWVRLNRNTEDIVYADPATIIRSGNTVKMWDLLDHQIIVVSRSGTRRLSSKTESEYDCMVKRVRQLNFTWHSGNMGAGRIVFTSDGVPDDWTPISSGSVDEVLWKFACKK